MNLFKLQYTGKKNDPFRSDVQSFLQNVDVDVFSEPKTEYSDLMCRKK